MRQTYRWGILGAGRVARDFAQGLHALPNATVAAVASRTLTTANNFTSEVAVERVHASYLDLVNDPTIDIIYVSTPHHRHVEDCSLCLNHGKAVLCEKPFALNAGQARAMIELARAKNLFLMEAMWMRFIPTIRKVRELLSRGTIGEARMLQADFGYPVAYDPANRFFDPAQGGGALLDRGVYAVSLAYFLFGQPETVSGQATLTPSGVDEQCSIAMTFSDKRQAVLAASLSGLSSNSAEIIGTHGKIHIHAPFYCPQKISVTRYSPSPAPSASAPPGASLKQRLVQMAKSNKLARRAYIELGPLLKRSHSMVQLVEGNGYNYEAAEVMRCLDAGLAESPLMPLDETAHIMETLDTLRASWGLTYPAE